MSEKTGFYEDLHQVRAINVGDTAVFIGAKDYKRLITDVNPDNQAGYLLFTLRPQAIAKIDDFLAGLPVEIKRRHNGKNELFSAGVTIFDRQRRDGNGIEQSLLLNFSDEADVELNQPRKGLLTDESNKFTLFKLPKPKPINRYKIGTVRFQFPR